MKRGKPLQLMIGLMLLALLIGGCAGGETEPEGTAQPAPPTATSAPPSGPAVPTPGEWGGSAEFGEFTFIVDSDSAAITEISYWLSDWTCGPTTTSGGMSVTPEPPWAIVQGRFSIETELGGFSGSLPMTIDGAFEIETHAAGTWTAVSGGTTCSGTWEASSQ